MRLAIALLFALVLAGCGDTAPAPPACGGDPCCGDPCCGDPCCGDPCCGDPCCGDPCCGDPCCGDPCCGDPTCKHVTPAPSAPMSLLTDGDVATPTDGGVR